MCIQHTYNAKKKKILLENNLVAIPSSYEDNQNPSKPLSVSALTLYIIPACLFNTLATAVQMANSTPPKPFHRLLSAGGYLHPTDSHSKLLSRAHSTRQQNIQQKNK